MARIQPIQRYGSKYNHLNFLHSLLPNVKRFVLPYGGSGVTLWSREPSPIEVWNDIDSELYNFLDVVLRKEDELLTLLTDKSFYSRQLFEEAHKRCPEDNVLRAFYFLVRNAQAFNAVEGGSWRRDISNIRRGKAAVLSSWEHRIDQIRQTHDRMTDSRLRSRVQIENRPALEIISDYDDSETLFYLDPPYPPQARTSTGQYHYEMNTEDHRELAETLQDVEGYCAVSGYECELFDNLYEGWWLHSDEEKTLAGKGTGSRQEVCYTNYDPDEVCE
ncbi:DNA adenine methylase [Halorussus limi]|uniref:site-specific DNA-methyltransferase (adenine-specific) n=1 Tax=Halorussus limi TaxID=2938695 RepID=A0A8U0HW48_9EURY|nr:DNA adenine methylase [Halorussus limi]UPV75312.1 DNA adenine methylase [Halorussus limi]